MKQTSEAGISVDLSLRVHVLTVKQTSGAEPVLLFLVSPPLLLLVLVYFLVISLFFHLTGSGPCHLATNNKYSCNMSKYKQLSHKNQQCFECHDRML